MNIKKCISLFICTVILVLCFAGCFNSSGNILNGSAVSEFSLNFNTQTASAEIYGNYVKTELINPGLDTADIAVSIYSLKKNSETARINLGEGVWNTGFTENGFFTVEEYKKEVTLYDFYGNKTFNCVVNTSANFFASSYVSRDGKYIIFDNPDACEICIYEFSTESVYVVEKSKERTEFCGSDNENFYLKSGTGSLLKINIKNKKSNTVINSNAVSYINRFGAAGNGDNMNFTYISTSGENVLKNIEYCSIDEVVTDIIPQGIIALTSNGNNDILHIYNTESNNFKQLTLNGTFVTSAYYEKDKLLVGFKNNTELNFKIFDLNEIPDNVISEQTEIVSEETDTEISDKPDISEKDISAYRINNVPILAQRPEYPTGCEAVATVMALKYAGYNTSVANFIDNYLEKSSTFTYENGIKYGPDPNEYFIGNPRTSGSYGCFSPVIKKALQKYLKSDNAVIDASGSEMEELCRKYVANNKPVIVWVTISMIDTYSSTKWTLENGDTFYWPANEHCMLLIGYDDTYYYFNDPYKGKEVKYTKQLAEKRYSQLKKQALVIN